MAAHCGGASYLGAMSEIATRLSYIEPELDFELSVADGVATEGHAAITLSDAGTGPGSLHEAVVLTAPSLLICAGIMPEPNVLNMCHRMNIPVALVEPPLAPSQHRTWLWRRTRLIPALRLVDRIWAKTENEALVWQSYGGRPTRTQAGSSLREGYAAPNVNEFEREDLANCLAARPVWFLNRLPKEEIAWAVRAIQTAQRSWPRLITVIQPSIELPSHTLRSIIHGTGLIVHGRDQDEDPNDQTQVFLADDPEETNIWYRLAALTYLGGTLAGKPSANPMIAASVGSALIHGPRILRHRSSFERLIDAGATHRIAHGQALGDAVAEKLAPDHCARLAHNGWAVVSEGAEMSNLLVDYIA
ncbi:MAG: hypothetical protein AAF386_02990, partial [Pseudomonadota bacterium]